MSETTANKNAHNGAHNGAHSNGTGKSSSGELEIDELLSELEESGFGDTDYLRQVVQTDIGKEYLREMAPEFSKANALANRKEAEVYEARWLIRVRTNQFFMEHPPRGSKMTGSYRKLVLGSSEEPITPEHAREILAIEEVLLGRVTQSRDMEQQKIIKEMRQDRKLTHEDNREGGTSISQRLGLK